MASQRAPLYAFVAHADCFTMSAVILRYKIASLNPRKGVVCVYSRVIFFLFRWARSRW